jgi:hypothetical protein
MKRWRDQFQEIAVAEVPEADDNGDFFPEASSVNKGASKVI